MLGYNGRMNCRKATPRADQSRSMVYTAAIVVQFFAAASEKKDGSRSWGPGFTLAMVSGAEIPLYVSSTLSAA
eukprot:9178784-Prorocentrum_lima.AAC.1